MLVKYRLQLADAYYFMVKQTFEQLEQHGLERGVAWESSAHLVEQDIAIGIGYVSGLEDDKRFVIYFNDEKQMNDWVNRFCVRYGN